MNLDAYVPAWFAAKRAGISRQLLNYWRTTGKVTPNEDGLYRLGDVLAVESKMRNDPNSRRGPRQFAVAV